MVSEGEVGNDGMKQRGAYVDVMWVFHRMREFSSTFRHAHVLTNPQNNNKRCLGHDITEGEVNSQFHDVLVYADNNWNYRKGRA